MKETMEEQTMEEEQKKTQEQRPQCQFWLPRKGRHCAGVALPGLEYCGNHKPPDVEIRVPCSIDPSHTILQGELEVHARKCPALKRLQQLEQTHYYCKGVNAGSDEEDICCTHQHQGWCQPENADCTGAGVSGTNCQMNLILDGYREEKTTEQKPMAHQLYICSEADTPKGNWSSGMKRTIANAISGQDVRELVRKIESAYNLHCKDAIDHSFQQPLACIKWTNSELDRRIPFQEKHIVQQVSLLGNLESFGLLQSPDTDASVSGKKNQQEEARIHPNAEPVFVEFGAGRGYLTHMLTDCYSVKNVVLVERRSYKFKADRTLRQNAAVSFERLRVDIENLELKGVKSLQGRHYIAASKHLCGYATDLTLRCCLPDPNQVSHNLESSSKNKLTKMDEPFDGLSEPWLDGIAIATCCHHLCQWKPYVNKDFFKRLGFTKKEFNILTWLTSWALSGDNEHTGGEDASDEHTSPLPAKMSSFNSSLSLRNTDDVADNGNTDGVDGLIKWTGQPAERLALGLKCKQLLDVGRLHWLRKNGMDAKLVTYVPATISPENKLLLARWSPRRYDSNNKSQP